MRDLVSRLRQMDNDIMTSRLGSHLGVIGELLRDAANEIEWLRRMDARFSRIENTLRDFAPKQKAPAE